jgi:co-chaperonin GroES (HSP10)
MRDVQVASVEEVCRTWQMLHDYVLIEDFGSPEMEFGRVILLSGMKRNFPIRYGKVLLVGPGRILYSKRLKRTYQETMQVKPGDLIIYWKLHGTHTRYESEEGFVLRVLDHRHQIQAIIEEPPAGSETLAEYEAWLRKHANPHWKMSA